MRLNQALRVTPSTKHQSVSPSEAQAKRTSAVVAERLNFPFFDMMKSLQPPQDVEVVLLALDLRMRTGQAQNGTQIRLTAEARAMHDMTNYLGWLHSKKALLSANLLKHQIQSQQPGQPLRFELEVVAK